MSIFDLTNQLNVEISRLEQIKVSAEQIVAASPSGCLRLSKGRFYNGKKYIPSSDKDLAIKLANSAYCKSVADTADKLLTSMKTLRRNIEANDLAAKYNDLDCVRKKLVQPLVVSDKTFAEEWLNRKYEKLPLKADSPVYITDKGEKVRSKSELFIANRLRERNIPYRYEYPLYVGTPNIIIHPDFMLLDVQTRKEYILEHFGLMDNESYRTSVFKKLQSYSANGWILGKNLLCTFESQAIPFNIQILDDMLDSVFKHT